MTSAQGIDLSSYQPVLTSLAGLDFAIIKATEGTSWTDPHFAASWKFLEGKRRGAYHFFHPGLSVEAQVALFIAVVARQGLRPGDILAMDAEISEGTDGTILMDPSCLGRSALLQPDSKGRAVIQPGVTYPHRRFRRSLPEKMPSASTTGSAGRRFLDEVSAAVTVALGGSYCPVVCYSYRAFLPNLAMCAGYPLWIADYAQAAPASVAPWTSWTIWQWSGGGGPAGADRDAFNGSAADMDGWIRTYTGGHPAPPAPSPNWTEQLMQELPALQQGASGDDVRTMQGCLWARGEVVTLDGIFGPQTRAALVRFQSAKGLSPDGIAGPKTWPELLNR